MDAGAECKRITQALNDAHRAIGTLRGILYSQINKYGRDYDDQGSRFLMDVDRSMLAFTASATSTIRCNLLSKPLLSEDVDFILALLVADAKAKNAQRGPDGRYSVHRQSSSSAASHS